MVKYEKGTLGYYQEEAKKLGIYKISEYFKWKNKNIHFSNLSNKKIKKEYHLWRWKIKRILIEENIIKNAYNWKTVLDKFDQLIVEMLTNDKLVERSEIIEKLKSKLSLLIEHHNRYEEIHGYDESIWMTRGEHKDFHYHLRKDGKCNIPSNELAKISHRATSRTEKCKTYMKEIYKTENYKKHKSDYSKAYIMRVMFTETLARNIRFYEEILYNIKTCTLTVSSGFSNQGHGKKLLIVDIN